MILPVIPLFRSMPGEMRQGLGLGAVAGGIAGLLLGLTRSFNRQRRPGRAALVSGIGALTGSAVGCFIWKPLGPSQTERPANPSIDWTRLPYHWAVFQEQVIELPETAEHLSILKEARAVEDIVIHPVVTAHVTTLQETVRHTEIEIQHGRGAAAGETENEEVCQDGRDIRT